MAEEMLASDRTAGRRVFWTDFGIMILCLGTARLIEVSLDQQRTGSLFAGGTLLAAVLLSVRHGIMGREFPYSVMSLITPALMLTVWPAYSKMTILVKIVWTAALVVLPWTSYRLGKHIRQCRERSQAGNPL